MRGEEEGSERDEVPARVPLHSKSARACRVTDDRERQQQRQRRKKREQKWQRKRRKRQKQQKRRKLLRPMRQMARHSKRAGDGCAKKAIWQHAEVERERAGLGPPRLHQSRVRPLPASRPSAAVHTPQNKDQQLSPMNKTGRRTLLLGARGTGSSSVGSVS
jgi:hypothetical protein